MMTNPSQHEQGTDAWKKERLGIPTASQYGAVLAKSRSGGKSAVRENYKAELLLERLTGEPSDNIHTDAMDWGNKMEAPARLQYSLTTGNDVIESGFRRHDILDTGSSPDGLIKKDNWKNEGQGGLEIKSRNPAHHLEALRTGKVPNFYIPQIQGNMMNHPEAKWWDWVSFNPRYPAEAQLVIIRVYRDEEYIKTLEAKLLIFQQELEADEQFIEDLIAKRRETKGE